MIFSRKHKAAERQVLGFPLIDLHCHMLSGVDDGAENETEMLRMIDLSYADGVRGICFTPHFQFAYYGDNREAVACAFERARQYAAEQYPELTLYLGNELHYHADAVGYLTDGYCRTLNGSRYVLVDFSAEEDLRNIQTAVSRLACRGYCPVLAHIERYSCFGSDIRPIEELYQRGCVIQVNASSFDGVWGSGAQKRAFKLLAHSVIQVIASDAHHEWTRTHKLSHCANMVVERCGETYAKHLFYRNPLRLLNNERL